MYGLKSYGVDQALVNAALRNALIAAVVYWVALFLLMRSLIIVAIIPFIIVYSMVVGLACGITVGSIRSANQFVIGMENGIKSSLDFLSSRFPLPTQFRLLVNPKSQVFWTSPWITSAPSKASTA